MRFNNRACALMDIPDLPQSAFEHIGDRKIKPQGGGGSWNPVEIVSDAVSSVGDVIASVDPGPSIGSGLAAIDPGPAIGSGLADVDEFVNEEIPGGWVTVGLAAATAGAASGAGAAPAAAGGTTAGAAGGTAAGTGLSAAELLAVGGFTPTAGSGASFAIPGAIATGAGAGGSIGGIELGGAFLPTTGSGASFAVPGTVGTGSSLLGPTYGELGLTGVESGLAGPTYGELGLTGLELGTEASTGAPIFDYSQEVILSPGGNYIPANTLPSEIAGLDESIRAAGEAAIKAAPSISPSQAVNTLRGASGLLGGQQGTPAAATAQFRGNTMPQGAVDYSGILNLLQARSPQRNPYSLLG